MQYHPRSVRGVGARTGLVRRTVHSFAWPRTCLLFSVVCREVNGSVPVASQRQASEPAYSLA